jgi:spermidine synthase
MYYHFVFMSISLAMLGFACSGICVYLFPSFFKKTKSYSQIALSSALFAAAMIAAIFIYVNIRFVPEQSLISLYNLLIIFTAIFLPYFFSGLTITLIFKHHAKNITIIYCYDLIGAGLGCIAVVCLLFLYDGISLVFFTAFIASLAAVVFASRSPSRNAKRIAGVMAFIALASFIGNAHVYRFLKIKYINGAPETGIIFEEWNPINRVTVRPDTIMGHDALDIRYDACANSHMHAFDGNIKKMDYLNKAVPSFYFQLRKDADVLIIGTGGGQDVLNAYINGNRNITAIEINPTIARLGREVYRDFNGNLFGQKGINLIVDDGRNFVRTTPEMFDIILLSNADSGVASSSGAFTFVENSLYTVEAFRDYIKKLRDDGVLWINRWRFNGDLETLKILSSCQKALESLNIQNEENHIVILAENRPMQDWSQALFMFKKTPFNAQELQNIDAKREQMGLIWLHDPRNRLDTIFADFLYTPNKADFIESYPMRIAPDTDNCPFFFNYMRPSHYLWKLPDRETHFTYPVFMFKSLFIIIVGMVIFTIFLPMLFFRKTLSASSQALRFRWGYIVYFACLGFGFMLVEIPLIQKFILFLGQPLYAIAVILSSLLIFSGIGSLLAGRFREQVMHHRLRLVLAVLSILIVICMYSLPSVFDRFMGTAGILKVIVTLCAIAPLGLLMGMALPIGIRLVERDNAPIIPWVWAINGACSVLGSVLAWGISLNYGFNATLWAAVAVYFAACLIMCVRKQGPAPQSVV